MKSKKLHFVHFLYIFIGFCLIPSCKEKGSLDSSEILKYTWSDNNGKVIENGLYHTAKQFDTLNNRLTGDTLLAMAIIPEYKWIVTKHIPVMIDLVQTDSSMFVKIKKTAFIQDTVEFQLIHVNDQSFLVINSGRTGLQVLKSDGDNYLPHVKTSRLQPIISIFGLEVGQSIDPSMVNLISTDQFGPIVTRTATIKSDDYLYLQLKQGYLIDQIEHVLLDENEALKIIEYLTEEFGKEPEISNFTDEEAFPPVEYTSYNWNKNDLVVTVNKGKTIPWSESEEIEETWSLKYNNFIISNILDNLMVSGVDPS